MNDNQIDFQEYTKIDKFRLPDECEEHSSKFHRIYEMQVEAKDDLDRKSNYLDLLSSQKDLYYRKNWDESKYGKMTESAIKNVVATDHDIIKANDDLLDARKNFNIIDAAKTVMEHRKSMLNNLTSLLIGGFYSTPEGIPVTNVVKQSRRDIKDSLNKEKDDE